LIYFALTLPPTFPLKNFDSIVFSLSYNKCLRLSYVMILTRNLCLNRINNVNFSIQKTIFCRFLDKLNSHLIDNMIFGFSMVELVRINVSFVPKLKKIFSTLTPSSGQTISSIGLSNISLESVLHKLSFGIKISRLPVDPKPYGKKTDFFIWNSFSF